MNENNFGVCFVTISIDETGQRIDNFLRTRLKWVPKSMIYRIVRKGEVRVNKKKVKPKYKLKNDDLIRIPPIRQLHEKAPIFPKETPNKVTALNDAVLYEDDYLLILNKPSGTAVHGGSGISFGIIEGLRAIRPGSTFLELVHRLDRPTSGLLLIAKKRSVLRALHIQLRTKKMQKYYLALVRGQWQSSVKSISAPLLKNMQANTKLVVRVNNEGSPAETRFKVEERFTTATLVRASPITGRTHQIRVHAQYAGHPVAFDERYGDAAFNKQLNGCNLNRLFLHACALRFNHPGINKKIHIEAPLDESLQQCLLYLRTHHK
ncbi:MAG: 23S rRNA pseudouridine(955/2504/2580) synthase RluC [Sodalis sp. (in: enterobacteria)]